MRFYPNSTASLVALALATSTLLTGCTKEEPASEAPAPSPPSQATLPALNQAKSPNTAAAPSIAPVAESAPVPVQDESKMSNDELYIKEMAQQLSEFVADYYQEHKKRPKDINEMKSMRIIDNIPPLPSGQSWVIDQKTGRVFAKKK